MIILKLYCRMGRLTALFGMRKWRKYTMFYLHNAVIYSVRPVSYSLSTGIVSPEENRPESDVKYSLPRSA